MFHTLELHQFHGRDGLRGERETGWNGKSRWASLTLVLEAHSSRRIVSVPLKGHRHSLKTGCVLVQTVLVNLFHDLGPSRQSWKGNVSNLQPKGQGNACTLQSEAGPGPSERGFCGPCQGSWSSCRQRDLPMCLARV